MQHTLSANVFKIINHTQISDDGMSIGK
jgi:hypothetical protein